jgi:hypothetical protein
MSVKLFFPVGNQRSRGVVTAQVQTDAIQSLRDQRRDLHQSTYPVSLGRSGLILLSASTSRRHRPGVAGLHQIWAFFLYAGSYDVELVEQVLWWDTLTLRP